MNKSLLLAGAVVGGIGLGLLIGITLIEKFVPFCPACGGKLTVGENSTVCTSCGVKLSFEQPLT